MQLTTVILLAACLHVSAASYAQSISISGKDIPLQEVFNDIRRQTGYNFIYSDEDLIQSLPVTLDVKNASLTRVLDICFAHQPLTYKIDDKIIVVKPKPVLSVARQFPGKEVTGVVTDSASGKGLAGVTVKIKGQSAGAVTDERGNFKLEVPEGAVLVISYLGYTTKEVPVNGKTNLQIYLATAATGLNQLVVVGYGMQKKADLSGSVSSIQYDQELQNRPITNVSQAISGLASGVTASQSSGQPGHDGASLRIRGVGTLNNSNPLILIDGVVGALNNINPNDVASISILKDAAAAAIYGSRAANGVILVTTKKGHKGKTIINYNAYAGVSKATHLFKPVSNYATYMQLMNQIQKADNPNTADIFSQSTIDTWKNATDRVLYPNTNWIDVLFGQGEVTHHNLSVSGGNDRMAVYLSGGYLYNTGIMQSTNEKEYDIRLNLDYKLSDKIKIGTNISGYWKKTNEPIDVITALYYGSNSTPGTTPSMVVDGQVRYGGRSTDEEDPTIVNPLQYLKTWFYPQTGWYSFVKLYGEWDILKNLKLKVNGSGDIYNKESKQYMLSGPVQDLWNFQKDEIDVNNESVPSTMTQQNAHTYSLTFYSTLNYNKTFNGLHHLNVLLGVSREKDYNANFSAQIQGFPSNNTWELNAGLEQPAVSGTSSGYSLSSYFGRVNYNFREKYLFEANLRYDGSSRFASGKRWGLFPSFSGAWRLSEENFFKNAGINFINNLKLRASWGRLGNEQIGLYQYMNLYAAGQNYYFGNSVAPGLAPTALANPGISWETTTTTDFGTDIMLFKGALNFTFDWYNRMTRDILVRLPLSALYGNLTPPYQNVGIVRNRGWEVDLNYKNHWGNFNYSAGGNLSFNKNKVVHFQGDPSVIQSVGSNYSVIRQGWPINAIYGYIAEGTFKSQEEIEKSPKQKLSGSNKPGDLKYKDVNNDGIINGDDRTYLGSIIPKYTYGFNMNLSYKGVSVYLLFQGVGGIKRYLRNLWFTSAIRYRREINAYFLNAWSPDNPGSNIPRLTPDNNTDNIQPSSFWVQDASFLRLKDLQISYILPGSWFQKTFISKIQVYANGQNLATWTKYKGLDPESGDYTNYHMQYPNIRILSLGVNASF